MKIEIEKHLNDEMNEAEKQGFEAKLAANAALREELERERHFLQSLKTLMLREKIAAALNAPAEPPPSNLRKNQCPGWAIGAACLLALSVAGLFFFREKPDRHAPAAPPPAVQESPAASQPDDETRPPTPAIQQPAPVATKEDAPAPPTGIRGKDVPTSEQWEQLVNAARQTRFDWQPQDFGKTFAPAAASLKAENFTDAYVELQTLERQSPQNDTLVFLKAHCLAEMREAKEALRYLERLSGVAHPWRKEAEWTEGLCYLLLKEKQRAAAVFKTIAATPGHPYRQEAQQALRLLMALK